MAGAAPPPPPPPAPLSHPSDVELLQLYLRPRVASGQGFSWIHEEDLYAADPADLTSRRAAVTAGDGSTAWYFFTKVRTKKGFQDRMQRAVPSGRGSWLSERAAKPVVAVLDGGRREVVGRRHTFCFNEKGEDGRPHRSIWLMAEMRLEGGEPEALTLSKIYPTPRQDSAASKAKAKAAPARNTTSSSPAGPTPGDHHGVPSLSADASSSPAGPTPGDHHGAPSPSAEASSSPAARTPGDHHGAPSPSADSSSLTAARTPGDHHGAPILSADASSSPAAPMPGDRHGAPSPSVTPAAAPAFSPPTSSRPDGATRWLLVQVGEEEDGITPVFATRCLGDANVFLDAKASSPSTGRKRKGLLLLHQGDFAKKARRGLGCRCSSDCLAY